MIEKKCHAAMLQCTQPGILVGALVACFFDIERQFFILQLRISTVVSSMLLFQFVFLCMSACMSRIFVHSLMHTRCAYVHVLNVDMFFQACFNSIGTVGGNHLRIARAVPHAQCASAAYIWSSDVLPV